MGRAAGPHPDALPGTEGTRASGGDRRPGRIGPGGAGRDAGLETFEGAAFRKPKQLASTWSDLRRLGAHLASGRYDLIDAHGSQDLWTTVVARRVMTASRPPLIFTRHNTKSIAAHLFNRWLYRQVDHLIVVSGSVLARYQPFFERGDLSRERISVIHSAYRPALHPNRGTAVQRSASARQHPRGAVVAGAGQGRTICCARRRRGSRHRPDQGLSWSAPARRAGAPRPRGQLGRVACLFLVSVTTPAITAALTIAVLASVDCDASPAVLKEPWPAAFRHRHRPAAPPSCDPAGPGWSCHRTVDDLARALLALDDPERAAPWVGAASPTWRRGSPPTA
jgi:hypothetical protein